MTKEQKLAIEAMLYAFNRYGAEYLIGATYLANRHNPTEDNSIDFGEAYNICADMVREEE